MAPELTIGITGTPLLSLNALFPLDALLSPLAEEDAVDVDTVVMDDLLFSVVSVELVTRDNCLKKFHKSPWGKCSNTEQWYEDIASMCANDTPTSRAMFWCFKEAKRLHSLRNSSLFARNDSSFIVVFSSLFAPPLLLMLGWFLWLDVDLTATTWGIFEYSESVSHNTTLSRKQKWTIYSMFCIKNNILTWL